MLYMVKLGSGEQEVCVSLCVKGGGEVGGRRIINWFKEKTT